MQIYIEIQENDNRLKISKGYKPIVCGNTNYSIKFSFDETWSQCNKKVAYFVVEGKKIPVEFEGEICQIPAMPNSNLVYVFLIAPINDEEFLSTTSVFLVLEKNPSIERLEETEPFESYYAKLLAAINDVEEGNIYAKNSMFATEAEHSKTSAEATHSSTSAEAEHSKTSTEATHSSTSAEAEHSKTSDEATHSNSSEEAKHALSSDEATFAQSSLHSQTSDRSDVAGSSETQVGITGDQTIEGTKNFVGELKKDGSSVLCQNDLSNPNLLINGDFKINQRQQTTYNTVGKYTVDRWKLVSGSVTVSDGGIILNGKISQTLENPQSGTFTASADESNGKVSATYADGVFTLSASNVLIKWAKLELGSVKTPFIPKTPSVEFNDCHRFYVRYIFKTEFPLFYVYSNGQFLFSVINLPVPLRTMPMVGYYKTDIYYGSGSYYTILSTSIIDYEVFGKICVVRIDCDTIIPNRGIAMWNTYTGGYVEFDAEIY